MPAYEAPSTAPTNPLEEGMARIMGQDPMSLTTGTEGLINYEDLGNRGQIPGDIITIQGDPGTGATTAETWAHEIELENQRQQELEFEWQRQQQEWANALAQQEAALSQSQFGLQQAEEKRAAGLYGMQQEAASLANRQAQQQMELDRQASERAAMETYAKYGYSNLADYQRGQAASAYLGQMSRNYPDTTSAYGKLAQTGGGVGPSGVNVRYAKNPGTATGMGPVAGTVNSEGWYIPSGGSRQPVYMGKPGSSTWNNYMDIFSRGV